MHMLSYRTLRYAAVLGGTGIAGGVGGLAAAQAVIFWVTLGWVVFRLSSVSDLIGRFLAGSLIPAVLIVGFYAMLIGFVGSQYGVMNLFWHEDAATRVAASFFSTLFFGLMFLIAFYSDPNRRRTRTRLIRYLNDDRSPVQIVKDFCSASRDTFKALVKWFKEKGWRNPPAPTPPGPPDGDPAPVQDDIKRFLAVFFHPFWVLLLLPALAPAVFPFVPKQLPTKLAGWPLGLVAPSWNNVTRYPGAWLIGLGVWGAGLVAGRFLIWSYVEVNRRLFGVLPPGSKDDPTLRSAFDGLMNRICPLPEDAWGVDPQREPTEKVDLQRAVIRFTASLATVYVLSALFNFLLSGAGPTGTETAVRWWSWVGALILVVSLALTVWFLGRYGWRVRKEARKIHPGVVYRAAYACIVFLLAVGLALAGLRSAVFQVFLILAVLATGELIVNRLSRSWNWPIEAVPVGYLLTLSLVCVLWFTNSSPSKLRIPGLEAFYEPSSLKKLDAAVTDDAKDPVRDDLEVLKNWKGRNNRGGKKPRLAVLAVSGGANRAAFWTAKVLEKLDGLPEFREQLRVITGASGGMVGAAHYVAALHGGAAPAERGARDWLVRPPGGDGIATDSLSPVVRQWTLGDAPASLWPGDLPVAWDRGLTLERAWPRLAVSFGALAAEEEAGEIPSLIFSPMLVEDGRQLLISNLNLPFMTKSSGALLSPPGELYSYPSVEFFKAFPGTKGRFTLATAARLNASFPYASPAVYLPTSPYRRVVDAGYYDNYGVSTAASWIFRHRDWISTETSGVVLIQVRAYPKQVDRTSFRGPEPSLFNGLSRAFEFVTSPAEGGTNSREAATLFRNDQVVEALSKWFREQKAIEGDPSFFTTVLFENFLDVSMNWYTTGLELELIRVGFGEDVPLQESLLDSLDLTGERFKEYMNGMGANQDSFRTLKSWWDGR